jgi:hypothetical protein
LIQTVKFISSEELRDAYIKCLLELIIKKKRKISTQQC